MPNPNILAEQNAVEVQLYTYPDAARYLRLPVWVVVSITARHPMELIERFWHDQSFGKPSADDEWTLWGDGDSTRISFHSLASIFISSAIFRPLLAGVRFSRQHPRDVFHLLEPSRNGAHRVSEDSKWLTDSEWVMARYTRLFERLQNEDRNRYLKLIALHQARVESKGGIPVQIFPFSRDPAPDVPRSVVIDPGLRFGRPTVKGAPTDLLAERWKAGDRLAELAEDYGLTTDEVEEALRYETTPFEPQFYFPFPPFGW